MRQAETNTAPVLVADAAAMLGVSISAVREWRRNGILDAAELGGRQAVTLTSIQELAAELDASRMRTRERGKTRRSRRPHLRLVVDNT